MKSTYQEQNALKKEQSKWRSSAMEARKCWCVNCKIKKSKSKLLVRSWPFPLCGVELNILKLRIWVYSLPAGKHHERKSTFREE